MKRLMLGILLVILAGPALAQPKLEKFPFRLNWTLYGEHAPFFVARDKGFYAQEGLEVEIQEGSGSTTVAQLVANSTSPVAYVDAATMMRGVSNGMPIKAVGVTLQQSPMSFIYRADAARLLHGPGPAHAAADRRQDGLDTALRHGGRDHALERDHRQQQLGQGNEKPGLAAPLPARLAARLAIRVRPSRRGRRYLQEVGAGVHPGDRA